MPEGHVGFSVFSGGPEREGGGSEPGGQKGPIHGLYRNYFEKLPWCRFGFREALSELSVVGSMRMKSVSSRLS